MAYFPDVTRGQKFRPSVLLENNIRRALNSMNGFRRPVSSSGAEVVRVQVHNGTVADIPGGSAVNFVSGGVFSGDAIPVAPFSDTKKMWGIIPAPLAKNQVGDCIISGPVKVSVSGTEKDYVVPDVSNPGTFIFADSGIARVLFVENNKAMILLGGGGSGVSEYAGYFKIVNISDGDTYKVRVCNGADQDNAIAGTTDIGDCAAAEIAITAGVTIYLNATYDTSYHLEISTIKGSAYFILGRVVLSDGEMTITQSWISGTPYFGSRYYV